MNHRAAVTPYLEPRGYRSTEAEPLKSSSSKQVMPGTRWSEITDVYQSEPWQDLNELWHPCHISMGAH
jgi:hypothetical protein